MLRALNKYDTKVIFVLNSDYSILNLFSPSRLLINIISSQHENAPI